MEMDKKSFPEGWKVVKLGDVARYINGRAFKPIEWEKAGLPIIRIQNLNKDAAAYNYSSQPFEAKYRVRKGDLLFAWSASLGAYIWNGDEAWLNQHIFKVEPFDNCNKKYLFYNLERVVAELYSKAHGSGMVHVTKGKFEATEIPLPPLPEQEQIVAKIEELFSELDAGKQEAEKALAQLKVYRQAVLKWAFEGRLTNDVVVDGELPVGWAWERLGEMIEQPRYGTSKKCDYQSNGKAVLRIPNIGNGIVDNRDLKYAEFDEKEIETYRLREGDLLTIRSNGSVDLVGKCALITKRDEEYLYAGYLIRLRPNRETIDSKYLLHAFSSTTLRNQIESKAKSTSGVNNINSDELKALEMPLPPLKEQHRIVQEIEARLSVCDEIESTIAASLQQAEALRQSILKKAFEGKLL